VRTLSLLYNYRLFSQLPLEEN